MPGEAVRLISSVVLPVLCVLLQLQGHAAIWAIIGLISVELAHGGLDNLLAHNKVEAGFWSWGVRMIAICSLLIVAYVHPAWAQPAVLAALVLATAALIIAFVRKREYYLEEPASKRPAAVIPEID
jgi:hypothetical protein